MDRLRASYRRLHGPLWRFLLVYCAEAAMADAVETDTFVGVADQMPDFCNAAEGHDEDDRRIWGLALELAASARAERRESIVAGGSGPRSSSVVLVDPDAPAVAEILQPLDGLPDRRRTIVALRIAAELPTSRIAELLSITEDAVAVELEQASMFADERPLERIREMQPPDRWERITERLAPSPPTVRLRGGGLSTVAAVILLALVGFGLRWLASPATGSTALPDAPSPPGTSAEPVRPPDVRHRVGGDLEPAQSLVFATSGDGTSIYDLRLPSGERFRLSVPARLGRQLDTVFPRSPPEAVRLTGPGRTELRIDFTVCPDQDRLTMNDRGSLVGRSGDMPTSITFCRPDEVLVATVSTDLDVDDEELQVLDLRPVETAEGYVRHRSRLLEIPAFNGPVRVGSMIVSVTAPDRLTAVAAGDLTEKWTYTRSTAGGAGVTLLAPWIDGFDSITGVGGAEGVWVSEPGRGIANLDPETGELRWRLAVAGVPGGVWGAPGLGWFVWSSFTDEGDHRPPQLLRVDPESGTILWRAEGRPGSDWGRNPLAVSEDRVLIADVAADPNQAAAGAGSTIRAYDLERGDLDFAVAVDAPAGVVGEAGLVHVLATGGEPIVLSTTTTGLLSLIDLPEGGIQWSRPVNPGVLFGSAMTDDGTWVIGARASPTGPYHLDVRTGKRLAEVRLAPPPTRCRTHYGPSAEVGLYQHDRTEGGVSPPAAAPDCVVVGESQGLRFRNDGMEPMTLTWAGRSVTIGPDELVEWVAAGRAHPLGPTVIGVEPYPDLTVWVMASDLSPAAAFAPTVGSHGPVKVGMTVAEASALLGRELELLVHDTSGACVVIAGDPYSPFFRSVAAADGLVITGIDAECPLQPSGYLG